jgi:diguanylate cyclase (GGDEF)-like protein
VPRLILDGLQQMTVVPLEGERVTLGRANGNSLVVEDGEVSRHHCAIERIDGGHRLVDLESKNGTFLNGRPVQSAALELEDRIGIGRSVAVYVDDGADAESILARSRELMTPWLKGRNPSDSEEETLEAPIGATRVSRRSRAALLDAERQRLLVRVSLLGVGVASQFDLCRLMDGILDELLGYTRCSRAILLLVDGRTGHIQPVLGRARGRRPLPRGQLTYPEDLVARALRPGSPPVTSVRDPRGAKVCLSLRSSVQLTLGERRQAKPGGRVQGVVVLAGGPEARPLEQEDAWLLEAVSAQAAGALRHARLFHMATTDVLTGLYNREVTHQVLAEELARETPLGVILLDLDHFKRVNDTHGHGAGDEVLARAAQRIRRAVRREDHVCRWGGEEFLVLLPEQDLRGTVRVAQKLAQVLGSRPVGEDRVHVTASMGVAVFPEHGRSPEHLIALADAALYQAKRGGRDRIRIHGDALTPAQGFDLRPGSAAAAPKGSGATPGEVGAMTG